MSLLTAFVVLVFVYSLVSARLERGVLTPPILFTGAGMLTAFLWPGSRPAARDHGWLLVVAEVGLVLLLLRRPAGSISGCSTAWPDCRRGSSAPGCC